MPQNIGDNRLVEDEIARIAPQDAMRLSRYRVRKGDIVYSRRGDVERRALIREREDGWLCGTGCLRVRLGEKGANPTYTYYYLGHPAVREWIVRHAHGATMPNLNTSILSALPFVLPPPIEQRAIAGVLCALDDKIELNRRMNETLEAMARALFQNRFLDVTQAALPKGWRESTVGAELVTLLGGTPSRSEPSYWQSGTIPWINSGKANEFRVTEPSEFITKAGLENSSTKLLPERTTIIAITGATLGQVSLLEIEACANQSIVGVLGSERIPNEFVYFWVKRNIEDLISWQTGGAQQHINKDNVNALRIVCPPNNVMRAYICAVRPLFDLIKNNCFESRTLAALRDALLPKLLSGELRVPSPRLRPAGVPAAAKLVEARA